MDCMDCGKELDADYNLCIECAKVRFPVAAPKGEEQTKDTNDAR